MLSPIALKRRGHPRMLRKQSKIDIKRTRMKKSKRKEGKKSIEDSPSENI